MVESRGNVSRSCDSPPLTSPLRLMIITHLLFNPRKEYLLFFYMYSFVFPSSRVLVLSSPCNNLYITLYLQVKYNYSLPLYRSASASTCLLICDITITTHLLDLAPPSRPRPADSTSPRRLDLAPPSRPRPTPTRLPSPSVSPWSVPFLTLCYVVISPTGYFN